MALFFLVAFTACQGKGGQTKEVVAASEFEASASTEDGIQRMHTYNYSDTVSTDGHKYSYTIIREADENLPLVVDDEGTRYADNRYTLTIQRDGQSCFERSFTKGSFESYLSAEFLEKGLLDGMMYDSSLPGLNFAVSVTLPQSDMVEPLLLHVSTNGGLAIERDTRSENDFE